MKWVLCGVTALLSLPGIVAAQSPLSAEDTQAINQLTSSYLQALGSCNANGFADLFVPKTGTFSSSVRGRMTGREELTGLVQSERNCTQRSGSQPAPRVGGGNASPAQLKVTSAGVQGTVELGPKVGHYEDEYVKTPAGWRFAARTVVTTAELNAGMSASDFAAINALGGPSPGNHYIDRDGAKLLMSSGVAISVANGRVTGKAYQKDGSFFEEVYEKDAAGKWRVQSRIHVEPGKGAIVGVATYTTFVENMDRTLAFYHDALGMTVPALPESGQRPYNPPNVQLQAFFNIDGAKERHQSASVPGTNARFEAMEIQNVPHKTIPLRIQDPGVVTPVLIVKDVDALLDHVKQAKGEVFTPGGKPVRFADGSRSVLIRDVDGRFIELRQPAVVPALASMPESGIVGERLSIAVQDLKHTLAVYHDLFGFSSEKPVAADPALRKLTGLSGLNARRAITHAPGDTLLVEFVEYKGVDRMPHEMHIQDRGAARLQLRAENVDDLVVAMKAAGLKIGSENGVSTPLPPNFKAVMVADPNNFFLTPFASCDGCAPRLLSTRQ